MYRYLVIAIYIFAILIQAQGSTSRVTCHLPSSLGGGLMLKRTSGVPVLPTWRGEELEVSPRAVIMI